MKTKPRDAVLVEQRFARDRYEANHTTPAPRRWSSPEACRLLDSTDGGGRYPAAGGDGLPVAAPLGSVCSKMGAGPKRATPT